MGGDNLPLLTVTLLRREGGPDPLLRAFDRARGRRSSVVRSVIIEGIGWEADTKDNKIS